MTSRKAIDEILLDIQKVFEHHSVPIQSINLDISLLDEDFSKIISNHYSYSIGYASSSRIFNNISSTIVLKRRIPFQTLVDWLQQNALPLFKNLADDVESTFPHVKTYLDIDYFEGDHPIYQGHFIYELALSCRHQDKPEIDESNTVLMRFGVLQTSEADYPVVSGFVGWLTDPESGDSWGVRTSTHYNQIKQEATQANYEDFESGLKNLKWSLLQEVKKIKK